MTDVHPEAPQLERTAHAGGGPSPVRRSRLVDRLQAAVPLVVVTAPSGYGKTALLDHWEACDPRPFARLCARPAEAEPTALLRSVALALLGLPPAEGGRSGAAGAHAGRVTALTPRHLGQLMATRRRPFVLAVDDVEVLAGTAAATRLDQLLDELPRGATVALAGREVPAVHLGHRRVRGGVVELGPTDLALTSDEALHLARTAGVGLPPGELAELLALTEGWPAGLVDLLQARRGPGARSTPGGADPAADLLAARVGADWLAPVPSAARAALPGLALLDRFNAPLCDAALGPIEGPIEGLGWPGVLDELERRRLVLPVDGAQRWSRLHGLLRRALQQEWDGSAPAATRLEVERRASRWHATHGHVEEAIRYAARAGDVDAAGTLVAEHTPAAVARGEGADAARWLAPSRPTSWPVARSWPSPPSRSPRPRATPPRSSGGWPRRGPTSATPAPRAAARGPEAVAALARASTARLTAHEMLDEATYARRHLPFGARHATSCLCCGVALLMLGCPEPAREALEEGHAEASPAHPLVDAQCLALLAIVDLDAGGEEAATGRARQARALLAHHRLEDVPAAAIVSAVSCLLEARAGRLAEAAGDHHLTRHLLGRSGGVAPWAQVGSRLALARADLLVGARARASTLVNEAELLLPALADAIRVKQAVVELRSSLAGRGDRAASLQSLTAAELRVLRCLPTHLTLADIARRLEVSRNTVKSQAIAIYRKLGATSRGAAIDVAREAGLLDEGLAP